MVMATCVAFLFFMIAFGVVGSIIIKQQPADEESTKALIEGLSQMWNNAWGTASWPYFVLLLIIYLGACSGGKAAAKIAESWELVHAFVTGLLVVAAVVGLEHTRAILCPDFLDSISVPVWMKPACFATIIFGVLVAPGRCDARRWSTRCGDRRDTSAGFGPSRRIDLRCTSFP